MPDKHWGGDINGLRNEIRKHDARLNKLEKESLKSITTAITEGFDKVTRAITAVNQGGSGNMTAAEEQEVSAKLDKLNETLAGKPAGKEK